jgi:hypothetical protein
LFISDLSGEKEIHRKTMKEIALKNILSTKKEDIYVN